MKCDNCPLSGERDHCLKWRYADVQPVRHGRWEYYKNNGIINTYICTNCQSKVEMAIDVESSKFKYCPNCGARMDLNE